MSKLFALRSGTGPLVLLLHGIGSSAIGWTEQMQRLWTSYECLVPDMPGYGGSEDLPQPGIEQYADRLAQLLEGRPAHVIGVSFGGLSAIALARRYPDLVRSLVLADATLGRASMPRERLAEWLEKRAEVANDLAGQSLDRAANIAAPGAPAEVVHEIAHAMRRARPSGYLNVAQTIASTDARPWLKELRLPTRIVCGEQDAITGKEVSLQLSQDIPGAHMVLIEDAGHAPHMEQPDFFAQTVLHFLNGAARASA